MKFEQSLQIAASDLSHALRIPGSDARVWVAFAHQGNDGYMFVSRLPPVHACREVLPSDCGASAHTSWGTVPFANIADIMRRAVARDPVYARAA